MEIQGRAELTTGGGWRQNHYGEWVCEGLGVVVSIHEKLWLAYSAEGTRLGPFLTLPRAAAALEAYGS
jgi:hypothetical protein